MQPDRVPGEGCSAGERGATGEQSSARAGAQGRGGAAAPAAAGRRAVGPAGNGRKARAHASVVGGWTWRVGGS